MQVRGLPRAPPSPGLTPRGRCPDDGADGILGEQLLQRIAIEQRGALIAELRQLELEPEDLARCAEHLPDPQIRTAAALEDLVAKRFEDALHAALAATQRVEPVVLAGAVGDLVRAACLHPTAEDTAEPSRPSSLYLASACVSHAGAVSAFSSAPDEIRSSM